MRQVIFMDTFIKKSLLFITIFICFAIYFIKGNAMSKNIEYIKEMNINNEKINLKYINEITEIHGKYLQAYKDDSNNEYAFINNKIVGFYQNKKIQNKINLNNDQQNFEKKSKELISLYSNVNKNLISAYSNINLDDYILSDSYYNKTYDEISYTYSKYINGIKTNDGVIISLNSDGTLASYMAPREGLFDNLKTSVNQDIVEKYINKIIDEKYNGIEYKIEYMIIDYQNNKYVVDNLIALNYKDYWETVNIIYNL